MPALPLLNAPSPLKFFAGEPTDTVRSTRYIGCEIEVYNFANAMTETQRNIFRKWGIAIGTDGSLPAPGGREIRTAPASGSMFEEQMEQLDYVFRALKPVTGPKAGLHVHIDARKLGNLSMRKILTLYGTLEPTLLRTQPIARVTKGEYGKPIKSTLDYYNLKQISNSRSREMTTLLDHLSYDRYRGLNILPWRSFKKGDGDLGTVEVRLHSDMCFVPSVTAWATAMADIVDFAISTPDKKLKSIPDDIDSHMAVLEKVLTTPSYDYFESRIKTFAKEWTNYTKKHSPYGSNTVGGEDYSDDNFFDDDD